MDTQVVNSPVVDTIYPFRTITLAGAMYRIENRTPFTLYVVDKAVATVSDCKNQAQITVLPMNAAVLSYVNADYVSCVLSSDLAQISLPQDVTTFIRFTTFLQTENALEQQTNSAIATYNPASLEVNAIPAAQAIQNPGANVLTFLPLAGVDLYGWNGAYFTFDCDQALQDSVYGFIQQADNPAFTTPTTLRYFAGSAGLLYIPRILRYLRVACVTSPEWGGGNLETSMRRTVAEIEPLAQFRGETYPFVKDYSINAAQSRSFYIPVLPPVTRISIINNNANRVVLSRNAQTLDGQSSNVLDVWVVRPSKINTFYLETNVGFFLTLTNVAIGTAWTMRVIASF